MKTKTTHKSKETIIENARVFFSGKDLVTLHDAWRNWGRDVSPEKEEKNRNWFYSKMTNMKFHNIAKPIYAAHRTENGIRRVLKSIELTMEGKRALGLMPEERPELPEKLYTPDSGQTFMFGMGSSQFNGNGITIPEVMKVVAQLRREHPEFEITFDIRLRDSVASSGTD